MDSFIEIRRYPYPEIAQQISEIFESNGIEYVIEDTKPSVDITFVQGNIIEYILKVKENQFEQAQELLDHSAVEESATPEDEHYMNSFTEQELLEALAKPEDWDSSDLAYAKELLERKGVKTDPEVLKNIRSTLQAEIATSVAAKKSLIIVGYLFSLVGGFIGVFIATHLLYKFVTDSDGNAQYYYNNASRRHGSIMAVFFFAWLAIYLFVYFFVY